MKVGQKQPHPMRPPGQKARAPQFGVGSQKIAQLPKPQVNAGAANPFASAPSVQRVCLTDQFLHQVLAEDYRSMPNHTTV